MALRLTCSLHNLHISSRYKHSFSKCSARSFLLFTATSHSGYTQGIILRSSPPLAYLKKWNVILNYHHLMHMTYTISCMYPVPLVIAQEGIVDGLERTPFSKIVRDLNLLCPAQAGWFSHIAIKLLFKKVFKDIRREGLSSDTAKPSIARSVFLHEATGLVVNPFVDLNNDTVNHVRCNFKWLAGFVRSSKHFY